MAKKNPASVAAVAVAPDQVTINLLDPTSFSTSDFSVTGTARPNNATVFGTLTNKDTNATIQSTPPSAVCTPNAVDPTFGDWTLDFKNVPPGAYILGVNEQAPDEGADSVNVDVTTAIAMSIDTLTTTTNTATAVVSYTGPGTILVSAVIAMSKPAHGKPKHQKIDNTATKAFKFEGLASNTPLTVTAYPVKHHAKAASRKGKTLR